MDIRLIGDQICKFRKAAKITQEELGKAAGVSTQAVSRWECGGAPDITLLPVIADTLGVTVDALFGREENIPDDMEQLFFKWASSKPKDELFGIFTDLIWRCYLNIYIKKSNLHEWSAGSSIELEHNGAVSLSKTTFVLDGGFMLGSLANDFSYLTLFPEPKAGYSAFFADHDDYREFFRVMAMPYALEILRELASETERYFTATAVANRLNAAEDKISETMSALAGANVLDKMEVENENGVSFSYAFLRTAPFVTFLYMARYLLQKDDVHIIYVNDRKTPILRKSEVHKNEESK